ncbi:hypothetical protein EVAR_22023_1 [Eumeta japonica]|uniref:Uncharacterized protein n=1 Tax=Eumeta variegata TaxID=151549 RepID=A0A4C1USG6_EUMVA|nr:hypothetical protein EVAR_22023_1 [Eumeta japonica]
MPRGGTKFKSGPVCNQPYLSIVPRSLACSAQAERDNESCFSLYYEVVFGRRHKRTSLTQIVSQITANTFKLVKPVTNSGREWNFFVKGQPKLQASFLYLRPARRQVASLSRRRSWQLI